MPFGASAHKYDEPLAFRSMPTDLTPFSTFYWGLVMVAYSPEHRPYTHVLTEYY